MSRPRWPPSVLLVAGIVAAVFAFAGGCGAAEDPAKPASDEPAQDGAAPPPDQANAAAADAQTDKPAEKPPEGQAEKPWAPPAFTERRAERDRMVRQIQAYGLTEKPVLEAMRSVPRHEFVPEALSRQAYDDGPLPIGYGQTISQPYIVAEMTRQLGLEAGAKVLEIGTGSGYQAAVLTHFTRNVYTMEIVGPLAEAAGKRLRRLGYDVVAVRHGDGYEGWPEKGPFDAIIVTCATGQIPPPLIKQLKAGGRMVIPVGGPFSIQRLMLVVKDEAGDVSSRSLMAVQFVPLLRRDPTRD
ncbi:MAG: protein-L-isoaspartate(D-aspartate) O-methyltransferase [Planctomycetes bacterium]|nr:protein-L-isoaspartate(D-aspartate) O-methyltransferase [Planctomycetota bacterium]